MMKPIMQNLEAGSKVLPVQWHNSAAWQPSIAVLRAEFRSAGDLGFWPRRYETGAWLEGQRLLQPADQRSAPRYTRRFWKPVAVPRLKAVTLSAARSK